MKIEDFRRSVNIGDAGSIDEILSARYSNNANEFWLSFTDGGYPAMSILAIGDICAMYYFPEEGSPGMSSLGNEMASGSTIFYSNSENEQQAIPNRIIVPFGVAVDAAKEFFIKMDAPTSNLWVALEPDPKLS